MIARDKLLHEVTAAADRGDPFKPNDLLRFEPAIVRRMLDSGAIVRAELRIGREIQAVLLPAAAPEVDDDAWTPEEIDYLELSYCAGVSFTEMARALQRTGGQILQEAWRRKLVRRRDALSDSWGLEIPAWRIARFRQMLDEGQLRGANPRDDGDDLLAHRALARRFAMGRKNSTDPDRHCHNWTDEELVELRRQRASGKPIGGIAKAMQRTVSAVSTKITELALSQDVTWSEDEDRVTVAGIERGLTNRQVAAMLPGRSALAVKARAVRLVGPRGFDPWEPEEIDALRIAVVRGENLREFAIAICRPVCGLRHKCKELGLTHPKAVKPYTEVEDRRIIEGWRRREKPREIADDLGRPLAGVYNRAFKLRITGRGPGRYQRNVRSFEIEYIRVRVSQGWSGRKIAGKLRRSVASVYRIAYVNGIKWGSRAARREAAA